MRAIATFRLFAFVLCLLPALAAEALAEKRVALVIGNSTYEHVAALKNPRNDAADMTAKLKALGFEIFGGLDLRREGFVSALRAFGRAAETSDVALVFYAGHGLQVRGENYLVPVDARVEDVADLRFSMMAFDDVMSQLSRNSRIKIAILDACRDNPFAKELSRSLGTRAAGALGRGLSRVETVSGTYIAYATAPDNVAQDGDGRNSPFTAALLAAMDKPVPIQDMMIEVRNAVSAATGGRQIPWESSSLTGRFSFTIEGTVTITTKPQPSPAPSPSVDRNTMELAVWNAVRDSNSREVLEKFLKDFPDGVFAGVVRERLARLQSPASSAAPTQAEAKPTAALPPGMTLEPNFDRPGSDYRTETNVASPELCAGVCEKDAKCKAYTWVRPGVQGASALCWLKNSVPAGASAPYAVSGVKTSASAAVAPAEQPQSQTFDKPAVNGTRIDWCYNWGADCGQTAANRFCTDRGFERASRWNVTFIDKTLVIGANKFCDTPRGCGAFDQIACGPSARETPERTFAQPRVNGTSVDWCANWGANCGYDGADAFCRTQGFSRAVSWATTTTTRTLVLGTRQICSGPGCVRLQNVGCVR